MADLGMTYEKLRKRIGDARGYGTDPSVWGDTEVELVEMILDSGCRDFYRAYDWSFLKPIGDLVIPEDAEEVELPADFGFLTDTTLYFESGSNTFQVICVQDPNPILALRQRGSVPSGRPERAAIVVAGHPGVTEGQRRKMLLYPTANEEYTVRFRYSCVPPRLSPSNPNHHGGPAYSQAILDFCLAASEQQDSNPGFYTMQKAPESLAMAIEYNRREKPQTLGRRSWSRRLGTPEQDWTVTYP